MYKIEVKTVRDGWVAYWLYKLSSRSARRSGHRAADQADTTSESPSQLDPTVRGPRNLAVGNKGCAPGSK